MAHIKQISNRVFISKKLREKLAALEQYRYGFICAPSGYGKSVVSKLFFKNYSGYAILWINGDTTKEVFWKNFCSAIKLVNPTCANQFSLIGFPESDVDINKLIGILRNIYNIRTQTILIIENFSSIENDILCKLLIAANNNSLVFGMKMIFITNRLSNDSIIQLIGKELVGCVDKDDLRFTEEDIVDYFRLNGLNITDEQANYLFNFSNGWPIVVELQLSEFRNKGDFYAAARINAFLGSNIWNTMEDEQQKFLLQLSVFYEFSIQQCAEHTGMSDKICIEMIDKSGLFDYDKVTRLYKINPLFRKYVGDVFLEKTVRERAEIQISAARTYIERKNFFYGISLLTQAEDFQAVYNTNPKLNDLYRFIIKEYKTLFFNIANHYWNVEKKGHYDMAIIISFAMFLYNEKSVMKKLLNDISNDVASDALLNDTDRTRYIAEIQYVNSFVEFNDFDKMNNGFKKVAEITKTPVDIIGGQFPFSFECPSYLALYHRNPGALDSEVKSIEECAPNYYRITNGHGKGFEALMKAEVLYNRCEMDGADILCHKAAYMADSRGQNSIYIAANYLLAQISLYHGANDEYKEYFKKITSKSSNDIMSSKQLNKMLDICLGMLFIDLDEIDKIPKWLTDEKFLEDNTNFITLSYVNIIYGKYLIIHGDYHHFLGISGQFLGLSTVYSYIIPRIYTYIYLAIANNEIAESDKAHRFILEAIQLAINDKLYMPFVSNYEMLETIFNEISVNKSIALFIKTVIRYSKIHIKGKKVIQKAGRLLADFGLTARESEVAKLAAQRLTNKEIADILFIAESTVKSNMKVIFNKLSIGSRADLKKYFE